MYRLGGFCLSGRGTYPRRAQRHTRTCHGVGCASSREPRPRCEQLMQFGVGKCRGKLLRNAFN